MAARFSGRPFFIVGRVGQSLNLGPWRPVIRAMVPGRAGVRYCHFIRLTGMTMSLRTEHLFKYLSLICGVVIIGLLTVMYRTGL